MLISNNMTGSNQVKNYQQGFTLVELLMSIAVLAVLSTIAAPSISQSLAKQRIKNGATLLKSSWKTAKLESVLKRKPVTVIYTEGDENTNTMPSLKVYSGEVTSTSGSITQPLLTSYELNEHIDIVVAPSTATKVVFRPSKRIDGGQDVVYTICDSSINNEKPMVITLSAIANITMTNSGSCS